MTIRPRHVDFHCHLDLYPGLPAAISACEAGKVATLAVTTTPKAFRQNLKMAFGSDFVRVALGLHPHLATERMGELPLFESLLSETRYVGEVGLDAGPRFYQSMTEQTNVFRRILEACAEHGGKILSIHSVRSAGRVLDMIEELMPPERGKVVLHWFSGSPAEARRAVQLGCYFSINQAMFARDSGKKLVGGLPVDRLLTETDGPFVEENGSPIEPGAVTGAINALADVFGQSGEIVRQRVVSNFSALLTG